MSKSKRTLAFLLALVLCFSLVSTFAFAKEEAPHYKYLAIGDSTAQGYEIPGYKDDGGGALLPVYNEDGSEYEINAYPYLMYHYLKYILGKNMDRGDFYQYTLQGMRTNELYAVLDPEGAKGTMDDFCKQRTGWYDNLQFGPKMGTTATAAFTEAIKVADFISFDLGMNSYGNYLIDRVLSILNNSEDNWDSKDFTKDTFDVIYNQLDNPTKLVCQNLDKALKDALADLLAENEELQSMANSIIQMTLYSFASHCLYFAKDMDIIYKLNPDVDMVVMSMFNGWPNTKFVLDIDGKTISVDFGGILQTIFDAMDMYATSINKHANQYKFADCEGTETYLMDIANGISDSTWENLVTHNQIPTWDANFADIGVVNVNDPDSVANFKANIAKVAAFTDLDIKGVQGVLDGSLKDADPTKPFYDFDNSTAAEKTGAAVYIIKLCRGFGTHPSEQGCRDKFNALRKAYDSPLKASAWAIKNNTDVGMDVVSTTVNTLKAPVLEAIRQMFVDFAAQLADFFQNISKGIFEFFANLGK